MCSSCSAKLLNTKHGGAGSRLYNIWNSIKQRCYDKNTPYYRLYGSKNIQVCDEWVHDYPAFEEWALTHGYRYGMKLKRRNTNDNFSPNNCYFESASLIEIYGEAHTLAEWSRITGVDYQTARSRKMAGIPQELWFYKGNLADRKRNLSK